jgi:hypothetical protein
MLRRILASAPIAFALSLCAATDSWAITTRTFVASHGSDANPCSLALPCRTFAAAIAQTNASGEVIVLDSAGYGPVIIAQSVSIIAPAGIYAGITVSSGTGIVVNPGTGRVVLSGLVVTGVGGSTGIDFQSGDALRIERTTISGFSLYALRATPSMAATLVIHNSTFVASGNGVWVSNFGAAAVTVEIDGSRFDQNIYGADIFDNVVGVASNSSFSKNVGSGVSIGTVNVGNATKMTFRNCVFSANHCGLCQDGSGSTATIAQVTGSEVSDNDFGVAVEGLGGIVTLSNTTVTRNGAGIFIGTLVNPPPPGYVPSVVQSFQDNRLYGNTTDGTFSSTLTKQ